MAAKLGERNGKRTARDSGPVQRITPPVRRRSWPLVATGVLAMAVGALVFGLARSSIDHRQTVLALVHPVTAGESLTSSDLGVVEVSISPGISVIPSYEESSVLGRTASTNLVAGELLVPAELGASSTVKPGDSVVAVDLHQGSVPVSLVPGDRVIVIDTAASGGSTSSVLGQASVLAVSGPDPSGDVSVSLVAPIGAAPSMAAASAVGNVSVVLLPAS